LTARDSKPVSNIQLPNRYFLAENQKEKNKYKKWFDSFFLVKYLYFVVWFSHKNSKKN